MRRRLRRFTASATLDDRVATAAADRIILGDRQRPNRRDHIRIRLPLAKQGVALALPHVWTFQHLDVRVLGSGLQKLPSCVRFQQLLGLPVAINHEQSRRVAHLRRRQQVGAVPPIRRVRVPAPRALKRRRRPGSRLRLLAQRVDLCIRVRQRGHAERLVNGQLEVSLCLGIRRTRRLRPQQHDAPLVAEGRVAPVLLLYTTGPSKDLDLARARGNHLRTAADAERHMRHGGSRRQLR
mmetsp:Transcript_102947/g.297613  ORF Transcript_102947/g.297613 Transcript_102947/m.297613 type:complete len:238 (-) Transcript_102947:3032-3745(-)